MGEWEVFPRVAAATGVAAQAEGVAPGRETREALLARATRAIREARETAELLVRSGRIAPPPA
jgi:malate dehydrogenase (oxaloacetate-decarboxylating)